MISSYLLLPQVRWDRSRVESAKSFAIREKVGGRDRDRTGDPLLAKQGGKNTKCFVWCRLQEKNFRAEPGQEMKIQLGSMVAGILMRTVKTILLMRVTQMEALEAVLVRLDAPDSHPCLHSSCSNRSGQFLFLHGKLLPLTVPSEAGRAAYLYFAIREAS